MTKQQAAAAGTSGSAARRQGGRRGTHLKRTSIYLPPELVRQAQQALGTTGVTSTVVHAMEEAVRLRLRLRLLQRDMAELTPELIEELRRPRLAEKETSR